jgi:hypothetical protein
MSDRKCEVEQSGRPSPSWAEGRRLDLVPRFQVPAVVYPETTFAFWAAQFWAAGRAEVPRWERIH